ncbi:TetR/AcrR family transcriptional regulator [uncultured Gordonia sp.]|uniref:TetR/AcrR family transcriptional regulator n=1 Tax=uncultured Gordonia sp. TaxID=198437 RepID=UPI002590071D|nr:TetR/AcrR family transcriptional regulator [uncultured Gordonia sp.]
MNTSKVWGGQSPQDRSSSRRESLLSAAEALLGDGGAVAVTMRAVVRAAQLSPRYFYESFASREELLYAVHDRVEDQLLQRLQNVNSSGDLRDAVRSSFEIIRDFFEEDPRRARILLREPLADDMLRSHSATRIPIFTRAVIQLLAQGHPEVAEATGGDEADWMIRSTALSGALISLYLEYTDGHIDVEPDRLVDAAVDVVYALGGLRDTRP